jgi:ribosome-associated heat shock protein Hsp15
MSEDTRRLDQWLWYARFFKSRSLANRFCVSGKVRVNRQPVSKARHSLCVGDVLTFAKGPYIRIIEVKELGTRRGPALEAVALYEDLDPPKPVKRQDRPTKPAQREPGTGRPTKAQRRATDRLKETE